jgi:2,4-dienoyl-CoA reductase-like NADH-dependent reductase (Old Yellow Enzyme family)
MHERFHYKTSEDLIRKASDMWYVLPFSNDVTPLLEKIKMGELTLPNRLVVQPMEGYDSDNEGAPSELTERRYLRYSAGASGVIWFEAVSVNYEGRSNPRQLWINRKSKDKFAFLNEKIRKHTGIVGGTPFLVMQLTHSGRDSRPEGKPEPRVAPLTRYLIRSLL